ncbi:MAG: permease-like cell division protein FtsX [Dysgonamonadaceae bacterium]|jgi:cell division transport system permease protein|nr:permease-like cell division protein FtsX [Dysgonamonadaceae bacterium]
MAKKRNLLRITFFNSRLTAIVSVSLVLFLLGILILLSIFAAKLSTHVSESISFDIVLADDITEPQINQLMTRLNRASFVKTAKFISKDDAIKEIEREIGQDPSEFLGFNPLPAMIVVNLKAQYARTDSLPAVERYVRSYSASISKFQHRKELLQLTNENLARAWLVFFGLASVLFMISLALIGNTVRLSVYSKRFLIHTMKLVGATAGFIRQPFIKSFIVSGIVAALITNIFLTWLLVYFAGSLDRITELFAVHELLLVYAGVVALGIIISAVSTYFAVNRYLSMKGDEMYLV